MRASSGVVWRTLRLWYDGMLGLAVLNALWVAAALTVILLPPATAGLYAVTHSLAHGTGQRLDDFVTGARRYVWASYRWALLNGVVAALLAVDLLFYSGTESLWGFVVQAGLSMAGLLWLAAQLYFWPFMFEQEDKRVRVALKNAFFLVLASPFYALVMLSTVALLGVLSVAVVLPLAVFWVSFTALLGSVAVFERLTTFGKLQPDTHAIPDHSRSSL